MKPVDTLDKRIERLIGGFGDAVVARDHARAHALLAPWVQSSPAALAAQLDAATIDGVAPVDHTSAGNALPYADLTGSHALAPAITADNFRRWLWIDFTPEPGGELDYCLKVYLVVVELDGELRIGHLEPEN